ERQVVRSGGGWCEAEEGAEVGEDLVELGEVVGVGDGDGTGALAGGSDHAAAAQDLFVDADAEHRLVVEEGEHPGEEVPRAGSVSGLKPIPDGDVEIGDFAGGHRAAGAAGIFVQYVATGHAAHDAVERRACGRDQARHDLVGGDGLFLDVANVLDLP